jgi:Tol biopolymer transport system component
VPGNAVSSKPAISSDGRFVAFASSSNLISGVGGSQIYLHDWQTNQTSLVSRDSGTTINPGNGVSDTPSISADGRFVAFVSSSTNLVPGVSGQLIYLRDVQAGVTSLVSKDNFGNPASAGSKNTAPSISGDGRFIAFVSNATNFGTSGQQIYLHDTQVSGAFPNGQTILISKDNTTPTPIPGNFPSDSPSISIDGCFVAFTSQSTNLGAPANQILIRGPLAIGGCVGSEQTSLVSKDSAGNPANSVAGGTIDPSANGNGQFIAFSSTATNLVSPPPGNRQIYVRAMP